MPVSMLTNFGMNMLGGARAAKAPGGAFLTLLLLALVSLLIRAYLVQLTWNMVADKFSADARPVTFWDALLMVILVQNLVN